MGILKKLERAVKFIGICSLISFPFIISAMLTQLLINTLYETSGIVKMLITWIIMIIGALIGIIYSIRIFMRKNW